MGGIEVLQAAPTVFCKVWHATRMSALVLDIAVTKPLSAPKIRVREKLYQLAKLVFWAAVHVVLVLTVKQLMSLFFQVIQAGPCAAFAAAYSAGVANSDAGAKYGGEAMTGVVQVAVVFLVV
jgi:hypothetical protein